MRFVQSQGAWAAGGLGTNGLCILDIQRIFDPNRFSLTHFQHITKNQQW